MSSKHQQYILPLPAKTAYSREYFQVSACNSTALQEIDKYPNWSSHAIVLCGAEGSGKTHLAHIWQSSSDAVWLNDMDAYDVKDFSSTAYIVDDVTRFLGTQSTERKLLHLYNRAKEEGSHILMTANTSPTQWSFVLPDLQSRCRALPVIHIDVPDDTALEMVLAKQFSDRQLVLTPDVLAYILPRMERSFDAARRLVAQIDEKALEEKRAVTIPLVRALLAERPIATRR